MQTISAGKILRLVEAARAVVFDFDGTLVDSNEIKWKGFEYAFAAYPERLSEISRFCRTENHMIRGAKFRYVCEHILKVPYTEQLDYKFHALYAEYTTDAVVAAPETPGGLDFVRGIRHCPVALLSSTPHEILLEILRRRGWAAMFQYIQGAPVSKREWLQRFQESLGCSPSDIVFFGDTDEDEQIGRAHV